MKVKPTSRWTYGFRLKRLGEVPNPTEEKMEVSDAIAQWLSRNNLAHIISSKETSTKSTSKTQKSKPPQWVTTAVDYLNNSNNDLSEISNLLTEEDYNKLLELKQENKLTSSELKKLSNESLKNLEDYFINKK